MNASAWASCSRKRLPGWDEWIVGAARRDLGVVFYAPAYGAMGKNIFAGMLVYEDEQAVR